MTPLPEKNSPSAHLPSAPVHGSGAVNTIVTEAQVREVLKQVEDPELHMDIITLELVYGIQITRGNVVVTMTLTTPACPYGPMLVEMVKLSVRKIPGVENVDVKVTFDPVWQPSDDLKAMMGLL